MDSAGAILVAILLLANRIGIKGEELSYNFYEKSCPQVEDIVRSGLGTIFLTDPTSPAALLRLMFHDCQVQGCDASILLDPLYGQGLSEMASTKNFGIRKRESISIIKSMVEAECPQQVSCADILILAARDAVAMSGGPRVTVPLGRRDSSVPRYELANAFLPAATIGVEGMLQTFTKKGMSIEESVAIMGADSLGVTLCLNIPNRVYESEGGEARRQDPRFEAFLNLNCPQGSLTSNVSFVPNDPTPFVFDNQYYMDSMGGHGLLRIDAELVLDPRTAKVAKYFATNQSDFFNAFSKAFVKLSFRCFGGKSRYY
ncbi:Peroxidase [Quillaja saponaria]|uniref:Peroxidase n=1 Tax=Quillaja saponaria TaxID=32244 RepID=A0AAD7QGH2_QUISA|nr:Peroxidase [Quillaja saponaria]